jgi:hypothetical integral membrane protein (TIGR02206 family)
MTVVPVPLAVAHRSPLLGSEHLALIGFFLVVCVVIAIVGRRLRGSPSEPLFRRCFAILIPIVTIPLQVDQFLPGQYDLRTSWPFEICDLAWMIATVALLTRDRRAVQVLYYWGLVLVPQAIVTPSLGQQFPDPRWFMFWAMHFLTVWATVYLTFGLGERPTWRGYWFTVAVTTTWAVVVEVINSALNTNYGYLDAKPSTHSLLDLLGPWPLYVVAEVVILMVVWALITWPWTRRPERVAGGR